VIESHLRNAAKQQETDAIILTGDFNSVPSSEPVSVFKNSQLALNDVFEDSKERISEFSFPKKSPYMDSSLWPDRWIDYIFTSNSIILKSRKLSLNGGKGGGFVSDHVALEATFELCT
jgi:endonuclease/exonuclease/phosphatase family metal-dependent hydrolase